MMKSLERTIKSVAENPRYIFRLTIQGVMVGIFAGLMVCLYRFLLYGSEHVLRDYLTIIRGNLLYIVLFFIALAVMGILIDLLTKWEVKVRPFRLVVWPEKEWQNFSKDPRLMS